MNGQRNNKLKNGELPISPEKAETPVPEGRIELAPPPDIDITTDQLGKLLLERRRSMGLKIEDVAEDIKVKPDFLRAIEQEDFGSLPTPEYARLFIKAYAERLGFNLAEIYALIDVNPLIPAVSSRPDIAVPPEPSKPFLPPPETAAPRQKKKPSLVLPLVILAVVIVAVIVVALVRRSAKREDGSPQTETTTQADTRSNPPPAPEAIASDSLPMPAMTETAGPMELTLQFESNTWVFLEADHDTVVNSRLLKAGERIDVTATESFVLSLGHTQGVAAAINGRPLRAFSSWTNRLIRYQITQDTVLKLAGPARSADSSSAR